MILLDTCALLWLASDQTRLSRTARDLLRRRAGELFVSAISAFEVGIKHRRGALRLPSDPESWFVAAIAHHGLIEVPVGGAIAARSTMLPALHADPVDRILVATAQIHDLTILTPDALIHAYPDVRTDW